jgi:hypothetical protein
MIHLFRKRSGKAEIVTFVRNNANQPLSTMIPLMQTNNKLFFFGKIAPLTHTERRIGMGIGRSLALNI